MNASPVSSFVRNLIGFGVFLGVSFGVTYAVNVIAAQQDAEKQVAAAAAKMLELAE